LMSTGSLGYFFARRALSYDHADGFVGSRLRSERLL